MNQNTPEYGKNDFDFNLFHLPYHIDELYE